MSVDWGLAGSVILTGLVLVFVVLLILIMIVEFTSRIMNSAAKSGGAAVIKTAPVTVVPQAQSAFPPQMPAIQAGIEEETVAAIMAAVSCMTDSSSNTQYAVRSINRVKSERPVWGFAGMQQNTRPF